MDFVKLVKETQPAKGQVALFWLGQAGFLIKTASGRTIAIDPYFTDHVRYTLNNIGFKRLTPALCGADEIEFDALLISHEPEDGPALGAKSLTIGELGGCNQQER